MGKTYGEILTCYSRRGEKNTESSAPSSLILLQFYV